MRGTTGRSERIAIASGPYINVTGNAFSVSKASVLNRRGSVISRDISRSRGRLRSSHPFALSMLVGTTRRVLALMMAGRSRAHAGSLSLMSCFCSVFADQVRVTLPDAGKSVVIRSVPVLSLIMHGMNWRIQSSFLADSIAIWDGKSAAAIGRVPAQQG